MSSLPPVFSLILALTMVTSVIWIFAEMSRRLSVPGGVHRFYWASIEHACRYPAGAYLVMSGSVELQFGSTLQFVIDALGVGLWLWLWWEKKRDGEDDDFWSQLNKKIRTWAAGLGPRLAGSGGMPFAVTVQHTSPATGRWTVCCIGEPVKTTQRTRRGTPDLEVVR